MIEEQTFGGAVASARKALGLSQKELASRVLKEGGTSITPQYLNDIEHDRRSPTGGGDRPRRVTGPGHRTHGEPRRCPLQLTG